MTNYAGLKAQVAAAQVATTALRVAAADLDQYIRRVKLRVNSEESAAFFANDAVVDAFIAAQSQVYLAKLTAVEIASDVLGSDVLH